jgi:hypothetical protein
VVLAERCWGKRQPPRAVAESSDCTLQKFIRCVNPVVHKLSLMDTLGRYRNRRKAADSKRGLLRQGDEKSGKSLSNVLARNWFAELHENAIGRPRRRPILPGTSTFGVRLRSNLPDRLLWNGTLGCGDCCARTGCAASCTGRAR